MAEDGNRVVDDNSNEDYKPPLWRIMDRAYTNDYTTAQAAYAAEIRALADWLVPESICRPFIQTLYCEGGADSCQRLRNELLAEANRAERGE